MKIGNPQTIFANCSDYYTVYIQTKNWMSALEKYIKYSKLVFLQLDNSEGVIWEAFYNMTYLNKYIYNISDFNQVQFIIDIISSRKELCNEPKLKKMQLFLRYINREKVASNRNIAFAFDNSDIIYSKNIDDLLEYKIACKKNIKIKKF
jgi:hypothetical protein